MIYTTFLKKGALGSLGRSHLSAEGPMASLEQPPVLKRHQAPGKLNAPDG